MRPLLRGTGLTGFCWQALWHQLKEQREQTIQKIDDKASSTLQEKVYTTNLGRDGKRQADSRNDTRVNEKGGNVAEEKEPSKDVKFSKSQDTDSNQYKICSGVYDILKS